MLVTALRSLPDLSTNIELQSHPKLSELYLSKMPNHAPNLTPHSSGEAW